MKFNDGDNIMNENNDRFLIKRVDYPFYEIKIMQEQTGTSYDERRLPMSYVEKRFRKVKKLTWC